MTSERRRRLVTRMIAALLGVAIAAAAQALHVLGAFQPLELRAFDVWATLQPKDDAFAGEITIVGVTEDDIQKLRQFPITDGKMADLLERLLKLQPSSVGIDIYRDIPVPPGETREEVPPGKRRLDQLLLEHPNLVPVALLDLAAPIVPTSPERLEVGAGSRLDAADPTFAVRFKVPPPDVCKEPGTYGFSNHVPDPDGTVRRALLYGPGGSSTLAVTLVVPYLDARGITPQDAGTGGIRLGKAVIRPMRPTRGGYADVDAAGFQTILDFRGPLRFRQLSFHEALDEALDPAAIRGKIVLIGMTAESVKDLFDTAVRVNQWGVELHAQIVEQLLRGAATGRQGLRAWHGTAEGLWTLLWSTVGAVLGLIVRSPVRFVMGAIVLLGALALLTFAAFCAALWIPVVPAGLSLLGSAGVVTSFAGAQEQRQRQMLMRLFGTHVSPEVAETIWERREEILESGRLQPQRIMATVLFTDLRGFSTAAERLKPTELVDWLNEYIGAMTRVVMNHGGLVNQYTGDGLMAVFGAPVPSTTAAEQTSDAVDAVNAALEMRATLVKMRQGWTHLGLQELCMRVGIFSGDLIAGSLGTTDRLQYTLIGDTVNTASRLESFDKAVMDDDIAAGGCRVLIGGPTFNLVRSAFKTRFIAKTKVPGKVLEFVDIYGVIDAERTGNPTETEEQSHECEEREPVLARTDHRGGHGDT